MRATCICAFRFGQYEIQSNRARLRMVEASYQLRVDAARPRPAPKLRQTIVIDCYDDDVIARRSSMGLHQTIIESLIKPAQAVLKAERGRDGQQDKSQHQPFAQRDVASKIDGWQIHWCSIISGRG
jgi:hypothetical protein